MKTLKRRLTPVVFAWLAVGTVWGQSRKAADEPANYVRWFDFKQEDEGPSGLSLKRSPQKVLSFETAVDWVRPLAQAVAGAAAGPFSPAVERREIVDDVVLYSLELRVGPGEHDRIGIHRVVREQAPFDPIRTEKAVLMAHGAGAGFVTSFMSGAFGETLPPEQNLPVFLAQDDVDVWGIDYRWILVPGETEDLSFMADWGFETTGGDIRRALGFARLVRVFTGNGPRPMHLLGYSRGGQVSLTYLNQEAQLPEAQRHVSSFIALDPLLLSTGNEAQKASECEGVQRTKDAIAQGFFADDMRFVSQIGLLALQAPEDPSPLAEPFGLPPNVTNREFAFVVGVIPGAVTGFHLVGGTFGENGFPNGLTFTQEKAFFEFLTTFASFEPLAWDLDRFEALCGQEDVPFDDHMRGVRVPTFYLAAAGGFSYISLDSLAQIGSREMSMRIVGVLAPEQNGFDIGHADLMLADDAEGHFWRRIKDWIAQH